MITDKENLASDRQAVTATAVSTDSILIGGRNLGRGQNMRAFAQVETPFTAAGAATLTVDLVESANADLSSPTVLQSSGAKALAALGAGARVMDVVLPRTGLQYLGFRYTVATGPMTAGAITAGLVEATETPEADRPDYFVGFTA